MTANNSSSITSDDFFEFSEESDSNDFGNQQNKLKDSPQNFQQNNQNTPPPPPANSLKNGPQEQILSVSQLTQRLQTMVETSFFDIWLSGEISNFSQPRSGHCYFTLKDSGAQISGVIWKSTFQKLPFQLHDGLEIIVHGRIEIYPPHGKYQIVVNAVQPKGLGALELAFRQLRQKLDSEGLFDVSRKKPLPSLIRRVAVVTSATGAALHDFLQVLGRRTRLINVLIVPVPVQGKDAAQTIAGALLALNYSQKMARPKPFDAENSDIDIFDNSININKSTSARKNIDKKTPELPKFRDDIDFFPLDAIALIRGGGSLEDLWAFNEEDLVRVVADSEIPIVTGIGHEIDISLCDLAADLRALTPSEAAERLSVDNSEQRLKLESLRKRLNIIAENQVYQAKKRLERWEQDRLFRNFSARIIEPARKTVDLLEERLDRAISLQCQKNRKELDFLSQKLEVLSPLSVLSRGYSFVQNENGELIESVEQIQPGSLLKIRMQDGILLAKTEKIIPLSEQ